MSILEDDLTDLKLYRDIFDDFEAFYQYYDRILKEPHLLDNFVRGLNSINFLIPRRKKIL